ncbi:putative oligopeptide transporter, OPT superfamily [Rosa chinensis]|uniref:Putative oligopeptide transporter, OPT superfamily n=1 Tax=Rosa chinensis TaxID=74649 RepID=A0A2P6QVN5_ROSCH|nr:putative oligopeptide transporter, OPT superfamily [Rosa chinensis]
MAASVTKLIPFFVFVLLADQQTGLRSLYLFSVGSSCLVYLGQLIFSFVMKSHVGHSIKDCSFGFSYSWHGYVNLIPAFTFVLAVIFRMEKIDRRSCSTLAKTLGTIVSISGAFIVTLYKGPPQLMTASVDLLSHNKLFLPQSNWVIGGMLLGFYCVVAAAFLIVQVKSVKVDTLTKLSKDSSAWALNPKLRLFAVLYSGVFGSAFQVGLFSLVPLRKVMVMDYKLTYPNGTATTMLINSFHTKSGAELSG